MRVISGTVRGRKLKKVPDIGVRPTSDKIKESVFNIVQFDVEGRRVLDLFAGTGQLGIEAASRGAKNVVFVDSNPEAVKLVWQNLKLCGFADFASVQNRDALKFLEGDSNVFDLIFIDPPYDAPQLVSESLYRILRIDKLNKNGIIICELKADTPAPKVTAPYFLHKEYKYGSTKIVRYDKM